MITEHKGMHVPCDEKCEVCKDGEEAMAETAKLREQLQAANMKLSVAEKLYIRARNAELRLANPYMNPEDTEGCDERTQLRMMLRAWEDANA